MMDKVMLEERLMALGVEELSRNRLSAIYTVFKKWADCHDREITNRELAELAIATIEVR